MGVQSFTFSREFAAIAPEEYFTVPRAMFIASLPVPALGSYMKSSMTRTLCSDMLTLVSSTKVRPSLVFAVDISSFIEIPMPF